MGEPTRALPTTPSDDEVLRQRAESLAHVKEQQDKPLLEAVLSFCAGNEWYAVKVSPVREIIHGFTVVSLPCVPEYVLGVTNLRGEILSVCGAAEMLGSRCSERPLDEGIMDVAIVLAKGDVATAFVVDEIGDIIDVSEGDFEPIINTSGTAATECVSAILEVEGRLMSVLDVDMVLRPVSSDGITH